MSQLNKKLERLKNKKGSIKIIIFGLGSVGNYLLEYLCELQDSKIEIIVAGRNFDKMQQDVNIITIAASIRGHLRSNIIIEGNCNYDNSEDIKRCLTDYNPDIIVNSSRVYAGLKYGSISWEKFRAYGIWTPLSIKYIRNIMNAMETAGTDAIVINTSYSDIVIPWLKSAGIKYPDFGSGNLNHLIPRIKKAVAEQLRIEDFWNIEVVMATGHFHDVVISKEGQNEGISQLIYIEYQEKEIKVPENTLLKACQISMPADAKRNMMNASSNFIIIESILKAVRAGEKIRIHSPGVFGNIGGYPVFIDGTNDCPCAYIDNTHFDLEEMLEKNRQSLKLDGIDKIEQGCLYYTDTLLDKVKKEYGVNLPKKIAFDEIDKTAEFIIENIIKREN